MDAVPQEAGAGDDHRERAERCCGPQGSVTKIIDAVPPIYVKEVVTRTADKRTLLAVMKDGATVPGCELTNAMPTIALRTR